MSDVKNLKVNSMTSKNILFIHTAIFTLFVLASLGSPIIATRYPEFFSPKNTLILAILAVLILTTWSIFGGCPFTVWENRFREKESAGSAYKDPCLKHYAKKWFDITLHGRLSDSIIIFLLLLPILSGLLL